MPRVHHVKKARKAYRECGIKKGEPYYHWSFRHGGKHLSKTPPRPSQLTQSEFLGSIYASIEHLQDEMEEIEGRVLSGVCNSSSLTRIVSALNDVKSTLEDQRDECDSKKTNIEDKFPNGNPTTELLEERMDQCDQAITPVEDTAYEIELLIGNLPHVLIPGKWITGDDSKGRGEIQRHIVLQFPLDGGPFQKAFVGDLKSKLKVGCRYLVLENCFPILIVPKTEPPPPMKGKRKKKVEEEPKEPELKEEFLIPTNVINDAWKQIVEKVEDVYEELSCF